MNKNIGDETFLLKMLQQQSSIYLNLRKSMPKSAFNDIWIVTELQWLFIIFLIKIFFKKG